MNERLYQLLPLIHRLRDADRGEPLRALLGVLEAELDRLEGDIDQLYDNWFIETCQEWVVPYIGDLVKATSMRAPTGTAVTRRAFVANTLAYRRRKGTAPVLEQVGRDVTGWPSRATEYFQRLAALQHVQHVRSTCQATMNIRTHRTAELVNGPFEEATHLIDVHNIDTGRGCYNIKNMGVTLFRLQRFELEQAEAIPDDATGHPGQFYLHPFHCDQTLLNKPETETEITHLAEEINVPAPLRKAALHWEVEEVDPADRHYFAATEPTIRFWKQVTLNTAPVAIEVEEIQIGSIDDDFGADWAEPYSPPPETTRLLLFDPERGRVHIPTWTSGERLFVTYGYAAPAELGGGPYDRDDDLAAMLPEAVTWRRGVTRTGTLDPGKIVDSLHAAIADWNAEATATSVGLITILDNGIYDGSTILFPIVVLPNGSRLIIAGALWPDTSNTTSVDASSVRPHVRGVLRARGGGSTAAFGVHGLTIQGALIVDDFSGARLGTLLVSHCTIFQTGVTAIQSPSAQPSLSLTLTRSIVHGVVLDDSAVGLTASDTLFIDAGIARSILAKGADVTLSGCSLLAQVTVRTLEASNCIFMGVVRAARRQEGCVRYSYVPTPSQTPRRYRCQPDLATAGLTSATAILDARARVEPRFLSLQLVKLSGATARWDHDFFRLSEQCDEAITHGADDGGEMGAFHHLQDPARRANLAAAILDYLRVGMSAGTRYRT